MESLSEAERVARMIATELPCAIARRIDRFWLALAEDRFTKRGERASPRYAKHGLYNARPCHESLATLIQLAVWKINRGSVEFRTTTVCIR